MSGKSDKVAPEELDRALTDARRSERSDRDRQVDRERRTAERLARTLADRSSRPAN